ncbi:DoxX family protein [Roseomonas sp. OT10]|uniref:DoxX family protein n=1 Tax=Roseomonas cutis TaxID=2897332 RepID=UPI001E577EAB|nr:DoxX family protein [Roseomonas sp. OT10]UFN48472.1 DoxX family protein [Roseomonas sp. OT10]
MRRALGALGLLGLCAAYIQGGLNKLFDLPGAVAEAEHFGLPLPAAAAAAAIVLELGASAMILSGRGRWLGALALCAFTLVATAIANRYWALPAGPERLMTANAFFEHLGLAGAFLLLALHDTARPERSRPERSRP